jgi:hypothetical protein
MGILRCTNRVNWDSKNVGVDNPYIISFGAYGSTVYAGNLANTPNGNVGGPYRSGNNGDTWQLFNQGLTSADIYGIGCDGAFVYVANWDKGVARYPFTPAVTVGSLQFTLYAVDPWGLLGVNSRVKLYNRYSTLVEEKWVNSNSTVTFMDLAPAGGPYQYEVYNTRTNPWGEVYCGWKGGIVVTAGIQTTDVFKHNTPVMPAARVYINSPNQLLPDGARINVPVGTLMRVEVDIMNPNYPGADNASAYAKVYLDRDMVRKDVAPYTYDVEEVSPTYSILKGQTKTATIFFVIPEGGGGAYYLTCATSTTYSAGPLLTDAGGWIDPAFTIVGTADVASVPRVFTVLQNYPNPFNPRTTLTYTVESTQNVRLVVVDVLGREIACLVDARQAPNTYRHEWAAPTSGTYFAVLDVGGVRQTLRMLAIK